MHGHRSFQNFISRTDPETLAALSGGNVEGISPDMVKTASNVIGKMSPEELQRMVQLASSFQGENPFLNRGNLDTVSNNSSPGLVPPNVSPDMLKAATGMMSKMSPEELQKMFDMASSFKGNDARPAASFPHSSDLRSDDLPDTRESHTTSTLNDDRLGESSSSRGFLNSGNVPQSSLSGSSVDLQEQMRNQMKDPAMRQSTNNASNYYWCQFLFEVFGHVFQEDLHYMFRSHSLQQPSNPIEQQVLHNQQVGTNGQGRMNSQQCENLLCAFLSAQISHIGRACNMAARELAQIVRGQCLTHRWFFFFVVDS